MRQWNSFTMTFIRQKKQVNQTIGWIRGVYPTRATAQAALDANDLFVLEDAGKLLGAARINKAQVDSYAEGD